MKGGKPAIVVGVKIAQHDCVSTVEEVEKRVDVEGIAGGARGGGRDVGVDDVGWVVFDEDGDAEEFDVGVVGVDAAEIEVGVGDGVVDEEEEATATVGAAVTTHWSIIRERRRFGGGTQLCFLYCRYDDVMF